MRKAEFEQKYLGEKVQIELFDGDILTGFLQKTGAERYEVQNYAESMATPTRYAASMWRMVGNKKHTAFCWFAF